MLRYKVGVDKCGGSGSHCALPDHLHPRMRPIIRPDYGHQWHEEERIDDKDLCSVIMVSGSNMGLGGAPPSTKSKIKLEPEGEATLVQDLKLAVDTAQNENLRTDARQSGEQAAALGEKAGAQMSNMIEQAGKERGARSGFSCL